MKPLRQVAGFVLLALPGCTSWEAADRPVAIRPQCDRAVVNLALGPTVEDNRLAEWLTHRPPWPTAFRGYQLDDTTVLFEDTIDDQVFYDRLGGGFFRTNASFRSTTIVR